jgi:hypothetical protein
MKNASEHHSGNSENINFLEVKQHFSPFHVFEHKTNKKSHMIPDSSQMINQMLPKVSRKSPRPIENHTKIPKITKCVAMNLQQAPKINQTCLRRHPVARKTCQRLPKTIKNTSN